ncbi:3-keto-disaccharide hydrolase [Flavobacterium cellulosilyticum]|uniref:DUF1080 domain-containing protein n=1 Tax=Flavobacterium cellulosilyticum TaxID=2541731 RepID=A0A4R5CC75_9FLAO|nr:DUF1080 domain-containing protein [Flavobacterium cellulosilyticum]TDD94712.1 DUF1080 domain-containing protein [Flavobacterium cellulosilyticum]
MIKLKIILSLVIVMAIVSCTSYFSKINGSSDSDWQTLFNGKNLDGWIVKINHHEVGDNYANTFRVKDGKIQVNYDDYGKFNESYGHLYFHEPFSSYHLKFEYRFTDQWLKDAPWYTYRNSGVMFHSQDPKTILKDQDWPISVEYQILAEEKAGTPRPTANVCSPGTEIFYNNVMEPQHCVNSSSKTYKWDKWVSGELIVYKDSLVIHVVEGDTVLQYTKPQIGGEVVTGFDPAIKIDRKPLTLGYIALQAEGQGIEFKNIKIKKLK